MRHLLALPLLLLSLHAHGAEPQYLNAERDCRVANPQPQPELSVTWEGACKDGYADGMGVLRWFLKQQPHGAFEGVLRAGLPNGPGFRLDPDNATWQGDFVDGRLEGPGVYVIPKNGRLSATFQNGRPAGKVEFVSNYGDRYQGDWDDWDDQGKHHQGPHGQGAKQFALGGSYQGFWWRGSMEGKGSILYPNGERLDGEFEQGSLRGTAVPVIESKKYALKEAQTGSHLLRGTATNMQVPPQLPYARLTPEQQGIVKQPYGVLQTADEPPYPLAGAGAIAQSFVEIQKTLLIDAEFRINVMIGEDGKPTGAEIFKAPTPELGRLAASAVMLAKFKPAVCAGKPCAMGYPVAFKLFLTP
ncbi:energy transducer TonB [Rugamonas sp. DEMB1]|uniref:energy transducer TonB n=1 Tax=Rugamonas sp. DEMB1 TaxID=3039386 RepID=UPI00244AA8AF|nr:energy transducer TonB [Rugamonas sp. DEMB1]WGG50726.1 energy transducer TonB [Rugamonas sp. DEMB1]